MPSQHSSIVGGSSCARVLNCHGSARLIATLPPSVDTSSDYADEGTALHQVVSDLITGRLKATDLVPGSTPIIIPNGGTIMLTRELWADCIVPAMAYWQGLREAGVDQRPLVEVKAPFPSIEGAFGTCDLIAHSRKQKRVWIADWKFGAGVSVAAFRLDPDDSGFGFVNEQLQFYAVCARALHPTLFTGRITLAIVQPRNQNPDMAVQEIDVTNDELDDFQEDLVAAVAASIDPDAPIKDGSWCRFSPCRTVCPIHTGPFLTLADLGEVDEKEVIETVARVHLLDILDKAERVEQLIEEARRQAHVRLSAGEDIEGWKLVAKQSNRRWILDELALKLKLRQRYKVRAADVYTKALKSPAQIEKLIGKKLDTGFAAAPPAGTTLARASDKRPAVSGDSDISGIVREHLVETGKAT